MAESPNDIANAQEVDAICEALHAQMAKQSGAALWLAVDGAEQDLPEAFAPLQIKLDDEALPVPLRHPNIAPQWQPRWCALNLEHAGDSGFLRDSVMLALAELQTDALNSGGGRRIAGWLEIDPTVDGHARLAAASLGQAMVLPHARGHMSLLRWHDPAVLWALWPLLTAEQQRAWLGSIQRWWLLDPLGKLVVLQAVEEQPQATPATAHCGLAPRPPFFSAQQWSDIDHIAAFNHGLRKRLSDHGHPPQDLEVLRKVGMAALRRAKVWGFEDAGDLASFAEYALCVHPHFDAHPLVHAVLAERHSDDYFSGLVSTLTEEDWQRVRSAPLASVGR